LAFAQTIDFQGAYVVRRTARALLVRLSGRGEYWVPLSQVADRSEVRHAGDYGRLSVSRWWAGKDELLDDDYGDGGDYEHETHSQRHAPPPTTIELPRATAAYRSLALAFHPDRHGGDGAIMKAVNTLWNALREDLRDLAGGGG
jgi:hypothetical protein